MKESVLNVCKNDAQPMDKLKETCCKCKKDEEPETKDKTLKNLLLMFKKDTKSVNNG